MNKGIIALLAAGMLFQLGCGSDCSKSGAVGTWTGEVSGTKMIITAQCTFSNDLCESTGTIDGHSGNSGTVGVSIATSAGGSSCLGVGAHSCTFSATAHTLDFACDGGATNSFTK